MLHFLNFFLFLFHQTAVVQYGPSSLSIEMFATGQHHDLKTEIQVKGIYTTKVGSNYFLVLYKST